MWCKKKNKKKPEKIVLISSFIFSIFYKMYAKHYIKKKKKLYVKEYRIYKRCSNEILVTTLELIRFVEWRILCFLHNLHRPKDSTKKYDIRLITLYAV